jgi:glycosyltransferase involved in cell wall biosynthesis
MPESIGKSNGLSAFSMEDRVAAAWTDMKLDADKSSAIVDLLGIQPKMNTTSQTICLNMIVKNEASVIRRCLNSVLPIINYWVIVDTGSSDGTQDIILDHLRGVPGELHQRPWQDFAHNRSEALRLARQKSNYTLIIDADDVLELASDTPLPGLTADSYTMEIRDGDTLYRRLQLVRNTLLWRYEGVLHEYLTVDGAGATEHLSSIWMRRNHDGARRMDPQTYRHDVKVLEAALEKEPSPFLRARYRFYLAQSYRDCGELEKALEHDLARSKLGFWEEEVFVSLYRAAQMKEKLGYPEQEVIDAYLCAADALRTRAEALHAASRFCRQKNRNEEGYQLAKRGLSIPMPRNALFVEPWIYETGLLDEFSVHAYWSGRNWDCLDASLRMLATGSLSGPDMQRVVANARLAVSRLPREPNLGSCGVVANFIEQHAQAPQESLRSRLAGPPKVLIAILAKQKEDTLPLYLKCIEALDYPKSSISLYVRTNNNTDGTERILTEWVERVGALYASVEYDKEDVVAHVERFGVHEWNAERFRVLGNIRQVSLYRASAKGCKFYFVADVDNFIRPCTLRELVALDLPIVAPFLRSIGPRNLYSNYHASIDENGYYSECDQYLWVLNRWIRGVQEMPVVHSTYLIRCDMAGDLRYDDGTSRHDYVTFSASAREARIPQYLDNRQIYGFITFGEGHELHGASDVQQATELLKEDLPTTSVA